jgi:hypothetical protein
VRTRLAIAAVLIGLGAAIVWFVRRHPGARARVTADATEAARPATQRAPLPTTLLRRPPVRLAMPPPAVAPVVVPEACATGTGGSDAWWACLPRDPTWDAQRARYLLDRISTHVGLVLDPSRLECRARCCRLRLTQQEHRTHGSELSSSVGVRVGPTSGYLKRPVDPAAPDGDLLVTTCWQPGSLDDYPDRAVERDIVLAEAADELAACGTLADAPAEATLVVGLAEDGGIDMVSHGTSMPRPVMDCVSAALRKVGVFEPAPTEMARMIPMRVRLRR